MSPFCKLLFNLLVKIDVTFECIDLGTHLVIFLKKRFRLRGLVIKFRRELMILKNSKPCGCLELLVVQRH